MIRKGTRMGNIGWHRPNLVALAVIIGAGAFLFPPAARAQSLLSEAEARQTIEDSYGVQVLRIEETERDGIPVFILKVMNPAGNFDEALQVSTLLMNRRNGLLMSQFRHGRSGVVDSAGARREVREDSGTALRKGSIP